MVTRVESFRVLVVNRPACLPIPPAVAIQQPYTYNNPQPAPYNISTAHSHPAPVPFVIPAPAHYTHTYGNPTPASTPYSLSPWVPIILVGTRLRLQPSYSLSWRPHRSLCPMQVFSMLVLEEMKDKIDVRAARRSRPSI